MKPFGIRMATYFKSRSTFSLSGFTNSAHTSTSAGSCAFKSSKRFFMVMPVSMISSTITTVLPLMSPLKPIIFFTLPVVSMPSYDDNFTNCSSQGMVIRFIRSEVNMNAPLRTLKNNGFLPAKSWLISFASLSTSFNNSSSLIEMVNFLSKTCIFSIVYRLMNGQK